jgi:phosphocarrier protein
MIQRDIRLKSNAGLQAKSAAEFIQKASNFKSAIWVEKDEKKANAKSLLGLLALEITADVDIKIIADGEDEECAVTELGEFMSCNV